MKHLLATTLLLASLITVGCTGNDTQRRIREAVERQMAAYPHSTLRDLYKNFFQDRFGPGHIIADTSSADRYLRYELSTAESMEGADYEPTGYEGRFVRVNLRVISDGRVPYDTFFDAFVRSVNGIEPMPIEEWEREWAMIDSVIQSMGLSLADADADRAEIAALIRGGEYVMHHSEQFNSHYQPHYRIIEREIFEREILPLL